MNDSAIPLPPPLLFAGGVSMFQPHSTMMMSASDNWISQTRELRIENPANMLLTQNHPPLPVGVLGQEHEEDMGMDCESWSKPQVYSSSRTLNQDRPHTLRTPTVHPPLTPQLLTPPPEDQTTLHTHSNHLIQNARFLYVNARPVTPPQTLGRNGAMDSVMSTSSPPPLKLNVFGTAVSSSVRKQKFSMGPRGDCEKCRKGLKGHWVHVD